MKDLGLEKGFSDYNDLKRNNTVATPFKSKTNIYSDATITTLTTQNNPKNMFIFKDCFPIHLGKIPFDATLSPDNVMTCSASFMFEYYDME